MKKEVIFIAVALALVGVFYLLSQSGALTLPFFNNNEVEEGENTNVNEGGVLEKKIMFL